MDSTTHQTITKPITTKLKSQHKTITEPTKKKNRKLNMHNRMNNTYSLQSKQKIKIKLLKNHNKTKGPKTKLEQKISNSVRPKTVSKLFCNFHNL